MGNLALPAFAPDCTLWLDPECGSLLAMSGTINRPCYSRQHCLLCLEPVGLQPIVDGTAR